MEAVIRVKVWVINHRVKKHSTGAVPVSVCYHCKKTLEVIHIFDVFKKNASNFGFAVLYPAFIKVLQAYTGNIPLCLFCSNQGVVR